MQLELRGADLNQPCPTPADRLPAWLPGFLAQLELWGAMGYRLAEGYVPYKHFLLAQAGAALGSSASCGAAPGLQTSGQLG